MRQYRRSVGAIFFHICIFCFLLSVMFLGDGCGRPGAGGNNLTNCIVTVVSINNNTPLQSDVLYKGYATDDTVSVKLQSDFRAPANDPTAPSGPSIYDTIIFHSYHVSHVRSDGGSNPASFTAGMSLRLEPDKDADYELVIVRAFDKHRAPLEQLRDDGEIFTTSVLTFYGSDGNGNDVAVSGYIAISFANFPDV